MSQHIEKGYQAKNNELIKIVAPFGGDSITQMIHCPYSDKTYLIAERKVIPTVSEVIIALFTFKVEKDEIELNVSVLNNVDLHPPGSIVHILSLSPLKKEKSFLVAQNIGKEKEVWKIDIESGAILWKIPSTENYFVEDDRGVLYGYTHDSKVTIRESKTGNLLSKMDFHMSVSCCGIGLDINGNLIIGGFDNDKKEIRIVSTRGQLIKKFDHKFRTILVEVDTYNKVTYLGARQDKTMLVLDSENTCVKRYNLEPVMVGMFFVNKCQYLVVCDRSSLTVYD